jgi:ankyrin repeat protein
MPEPESDNIFERGDQAIKALHQGLKEMQEGKITPAELLKLTQRITSERALTSTSDLDKETLKAQMEEFLRRKYGEGDRKELFQRLLRDKAAEFEEAHKKELRNLHNDPTLIILRGSADQLRRAMEKGIDPNGCARIGERLMMIAARSKRLEAVAILREMGARTELPEACILGEIDTVRACLDAGEAVNAPDRDGQTPLMHAASQGHEDIVTLLLAHGADLHHCNSRGLSALNRAVVARAHATVDILLRAGATLDIWDVSRLDDVDELTRRLDAGELIDTRGPMEKTPLMAAAASGSVRCCTMLLDRGADLYAATKTGYTALTLAAMNGHVDAVSLLLDRGMDVNYVAPCEMESMRGHAALLDAAQLGKAKVVKLLLDRGANIRATDASGSTALHNAASGPDPAAVALLVHAGAHIEAEDNIGTPLMHAALHGRIDGMRALVNLGANVNAINPRGYSVLWLAVNSGDRATVKWLLEAGADPNLEAPALGRVLKSALVHADEEMIALLKAHGAVEVDRATQFATSFEKLKEMIAAHKGDEMPQEAH